MYLFYMTEKRRGLQKDQEQLRAKKGIDRTRYYLRLHHKKKQNNQSGINDGSRLGRRKNFIFDPHFVCFCSSFGPLLLLLSSSGPRSLQTVLCLSYKHVRNPSVIDVSPIAEKARRKWQAILAEKDPGSDNSLRSIVPEIS